MNGKLLAIIIDKQDNPKLNNIKILGRTINDYIENCTKAAIDKYGRSETKNKVLFLREIDEDFFESLQSKESNIDAVIILRGNLPFIEHETIGNILNCHYNNCNDATAFLNNIDIDKGIYCFKASRLLEFSNECLKENGASLFNTIKSSEYKTEIIYKSNDLEFLDVDSSKQLNVLYEQLQKRINDKHMDNGVIMLNPKSVYIDDGVIIGENTVIYPNVFIEGSSVIGNDCKIGPDSRITNMKIGSNTSFQYSVAIDSETGNECTIGPFAYIRPHCKIGDSVKVGDFVEVKNAVIGNNTKMSHLTYVGDADVGCNVNFGCGTVTVNYDGKSKFRTIIEDNAFIGCNTNLVSPVTVEQGAYIAAGSTITDTVPKETLAIARARQVIKSNWKTKRSKCE